jgi:hypothetical protein
MTHISLQLVEKDGTGIKAREACYRHVNGFIRADIIQDVLVEHGCSGCPAHSTIEASGGMERITWH